MTLKAKSKKKSQNPRSQGELVREMLLIGRWACSTLLNQFQGSSRKLPERQRHEDELTLLCGVKFE